MPPQQVLFEFISDNLITFRHHHHSPYTPDRCVCRAGRDDVVWMKACDLEVSDLNPVRETLRTNCGRLARWSAINLINNKSAAVKRLLEVKSEVRRPPIVARGQRISVFNSYLGDEYKDRRFKEQWVYGPLQEVVSTLPSPSSR